MPLPFFLPPAPVASLSAAAEARTSRRLAGIALAAMVALAIVHGFWPAMPAWPSGLAAWTAAALLVAQVPLAQQRQIGLLVLIGLLAIGFALLGGTRPAWLKLIDANAPLLTMIASVSFLRLVAMPVAADPSARGHALPVGPRAFVSTMASVAVFGAFINISAPILVADRLAQGGRLSRMTSQSLTRIFSGCPAWSPFFGGMAVVLTYVSDTRLPFVMLAGLPFALIGLAYVIGEALLRHRDELAVFRGYPMSLASLWVPAVLAVAVSVGYAVLERAPILLIIAVASLSVTGAVLLARHGPRSAARQLATHVQHGLPGMVGELLLFLAAGVLAVGLSAAIEAGHMTVPFVAFDGLSASLLLGGIILAAIIGIHPVIAVSVVTPVLAPIAPDQQLLAVTYLLGWSLGTCTSPLSGTHLIFQGRFGVPATRAARWNWPYAAFMYLIGTIVLHAVAAVRL